MSEPKIIEGYGASELEAALKERLASDDRPLQETIVEAIKEAEAARTRSRQRVKLLERGEDAETVVSGPDPDATPSTSELFRQRQEREMPPVPASASKIDTEREPLRQLADIGLRQFNAQLYIVQLKPEPEPKD